MILRDLGVVFVHIPRTAGTSVERVLDGYDRKPSDPPDYEVAWGWDPSSNRWMQHLTLQEMLMTGLLTRHEFDSFTKFAIVRNPYDRCLSDYQHLRRHVGPIGSFRQMVERGGRWEHALTDRTSRDYRGDHLRQQYDFVTIDGQVAVDFVGRFERLDEVARFLRTTLGDPSVVLPHQNPSMSRAEHYSHFYRNSEIELVAHAYETDLREFDYAFDDRRSDRYRVELAARRLRQSSTARYGAARHLIANFVKRRGEVWR